MAENETGWIETRFMYYKEIEPYQLTIAKYQTFLSCYISFNGYFAFFVEKDFLLSELQQAKEYLENALLSQQLQDEIKEHVKMMKG